MEGRAPTAVAPIRATMPADPALAEAAGNLLFACGGLKPGDAVVICREDPAYGWYDAGLAEVLLATATGLGLAAELRDLPPPGVEPDAATAALLLSSANLIFLARLGDQGRFGPSGGLGRRVMVYARDLAAFGSAFGRTPHAAMQDFKAAMDAVLFSAVEITITCAAGTLITGRAARAPAETSSALTPPDVTVRRFPLGVPAPVPGAGFSGRVALVDALTPTGNRSYEPAVLFLQGPVLALVEAGRITGFEGAAQDVATVEAHYRRVSDRFGIDPGVVHSWHGGLHPACPFHLPTGTDRDLWSNTVFANPRLLHFHTCGAAAPGEISWNIIDPTVTVDGTPLVESGVLRPHAFAPLMTAMAAHAALGALFPSPV